MWLIRQLESALHRFDLCESAMFKPFAAEARGPSVSAAAEGGRRAPLRSGLGGFDQWGGELSARSEADPDTLARAVRAHKAGDAFAQAALTVALMLAIGAVAFVLSASRASAAGLLVDGVAAHALPLLAVAAGAGVLILATSRLSVRTVRVRVQERRRR